MTYVNSERHAEIESSGLRVHDIAMANLISASKPLTTHGKKAGERIIYQAMMHPDGLGTSRLLLLPALREAFPNGFSLGIPERSCGLVVPDEISPAERSEALEIVSGCFRDGTTPMLDGLHEPTMFEVVSAQPLE